MGTQKTRGLRAPFLWVKYGTALLLHVFRYRVLVLLHIVKGLFGVSMKVTMLLAALASAGAVSSTIDPSLYVDAEKEAVQQIDKYNAAKERDYREICRLMDCEVKGGRYVL